MVVSLVVSPSVLVWMVIVVVSRTVSWRVRVTVWRRVSVAAIVLVCCVTVLLLLHGLSELPPADAGAGDAGLHPAGDGGGHGFPQL